jgi:hypothetical protein
MKSALLRSCLALFAAVALAFVGCEDTTKTSTPPPASPPPAANPPKDDAAKAPVSAPISNPANDSARPGGKAPK